MGISFQNLQWITLLSIVCLSVRLTVCQVPPSQNNNQAANNECKKCRPQWINTLEAFSAALTPAMKSVCTLALREKFVSSCQVPNTKCDGNKTGIKYCCCSLTELSRVKDCLPKTAKNACVPDKITPWITQFQQAFFAAVG
ncbi:uncharacterized protein LOC123554279 [Mercenaria mercenaria]|uniref:uncharacterized protein LOC123554279 n=1 Tax=Mercenaria mercenaria TaxID=6596 RepID=UPI001E1E1803|nr:uncharacterized protein LOC123554279 [Mercenaria mercenaria]